MYYGGGHLSFNQSVYLCLVLIGAKLGKCLLAQFGPVRRNNRPVPPPTNSVKRASRRPGSKRSCRHSIRHRKTTYEMLIPSALFLLSSLAYAMEAATIVPKIPDGQYIIKSQWGYLCVNAGHQVVHCLETEKPAVWELKRHGAGRHISVEGHGFLTKSPQFNPDEYTRPFFTQNINEAATLQFATKPPLNGMPSLAVSIKRDTTAFLDADRYNTKQIFVGDEQKFSQQFFSFVPVKPRAFQTCTFGQLVSNSMDFSQNIFAFPISTNSIETIAGLNVVRKEQIEKDAAGVQIVISKETLDLMANFLAYKKEFGTDTEKAVYAGIPNTDAFIDRLLVKRPLMFMTSSDNTILRGAGNHSFNGHAAWKKVGTNAEGQIKMAEYLTYEEMELAALISVITPTYFINNGRRDNGGAVAPSPFPLHGYMIGSVGTRFEVPGLMEHKRMIGSSIAALDLTNPINQLWESFYQTEGDAKWIDGGAKGTLHKGRYYRRLERILEPVIIAACQTAGAQGKKAIVSLVGLGLGVWSINKSEQRTVFNQVVADIIARRDLTCIDSFDMVYLSDEDGPVNVQDATGRSITLKYTHSPPVYRAQPGLILFSMYAWDGNSFPGNEYWGGHLTLTGDPAATCCSTISQLQNPFINKCLNSFNSLVVIP